MRRRPGRTCRKTRRQPWCRGGRCIIVAASRIAISIVHAVVTVRAVLAVLAVLCAIVRVRLITVLNLVFPPLLLWPTAVPIRVAVVLALNAA